MNMDLKSFAGAISQIAEEKEIPKEKIIETIESAIAAAYKKDYGKKGQQIKAKMNLETGEVLFWLVKLIVTEDMIYSEEEIEKMQEESETTSQVEFQENEEGRKIRFNPERHIMLEDAKKINKNIKTEDELEISLETQQDYGRIAAQTAKQVILQKIREAEREVILSEYKSKEGEILSGIVQRIEGKNVFMDIGKTLGLLTREEQVPGEFYKPGQRLKVYILKVEETPRGPVIFLSRSYPKLVSKLFELEVPEISSGQVVIKAIAREPGARSKIAILSIAEGIDPIGSAVGQRGSRVSAVISELGGEKIDIIEYSEDLEKFISNALSPAKVSEVKILPQNRALVLVAEDQLSLAIGRDGQNVRLAAKLTGWKIDVRPLGKEEVEEVKVEEEIKKEEVVIKEKKEDKKNIKKSEAKEDKKPSIAKASADAKSLVDKSAGKEKTAKTKVKKLTKKKT